MKKLMLSYVFALIGIINAFAQNQSIDLSSGTGRGITLSGSTLSSSEKGGDYFLLAENYSAFKGVKMVLSNFKKLDENASSSICSLNVYYIDGNGEAKKASMGFWVDGRKEIRFSSFKNGNEEIVINPEKIKKVAIGMGADKQVDVTMELVAKK